MAAAAGLNNAVTHRHPLGWRGCVEQPQRKLASLLNVRPHGHDEELALAAAA